MNNWYVNWVLSWKFSTVVYEFCMLWEKLQQVVQIYPIIPWLIQICLDLIDVLLGYGEDSFQNKFRRSVALQRDRIFFSK
jgi:hypothetical protein